MTRLLLPILSSLLAILANVDAKSKEDQIRLYQFTGDGCGTGPKGAQIDAKRDACVRLDARSLKPSIDMKRKKWLDDVNKGEVQCALEIFDNISCTGERIKLVKLPEDVTNCYTTDGPAPIRSAKFYCAEKILLNEVTTVIVEEVEATSWSVGKDEKPTPYTTSTIITSTGTMTETLSTTLSAAEHRLEPRAVKADSTSVWMAHPWSGTVICYHCHTTKDAGDFSNFKCESGPEVAGSHACEPRDPPAVGESLTTTVTEGSTTTKSTLTDGTWTTESSTTSTVEITPSALMARKSWHKDVSFTNPWDNSRICADAEWEKRGKPNTEIRLQKIKVDDGSKCKDSLNLDLPRVTETVFSADATKVITGYTIQETVTVTSFVLSIADAETETTESSATTTIFPEAGQGNNPRHSDL